MRALSAAQQEETVRLGLWMFLATVAMLFAAFASAYIVRRSGSDWRPIALPPLLWLNTLVLAASSLALEGGVAGGARGRWTAAGAMMAAALVLGGVFLAGQVAAWRQMLARGVSLPAGPHGAFVYLLTGAHAVHVAAAIGVLGHAAGLTWSDVGRGEPDRWRVAVSLTRTFWHFLLGVWIAVFVLLRAA